jgi:stalled ribosome alternative rescue factor ArfA
MLGEELQAYLQIMKQHRIKQNKKGKGSYSRKQKHKNGDDF